MADIVNDTKEESSMMQTQQSEDSKIYAKTVTVSPVKILPAAETVNIKLASLNKALASNTFVSRTIDINRMDQDVLKNAKPAPF